ncbi:MAG TPA: helix-turn-helix domain-containing protein, partial [Candidatus Norongarragalinales archaeon]|nr:helix-turn-helix domain-containing protein [Candidatus Norongarragalinales archaeon]
SRENFPDSLLHLIGETNVFSRNRFSGQEMTQILEHRIRAVGGKSLVPFSQAFLKGLFTEQNLLSPRYVFDELNAHLASLSLGETGSERFRSEKTGDVVPESTGFLEKTHASWWPLLSPSQSSILDLLIQHEPGLTLQDIMQKTQLSQNTAFNALYQLRGDDGAEKRRKPSVPFPLVKANPLLVGARKKNVYVVVPKVRNLFTTH